ncbi:MAG: sigma-70 family RNA polymerase sigma factor [Phycisphaerales bacterium]|nr:sigma-70 family RNA polymerase sigma factor [Phycisphaerales bacterium]
MTERPAAAPRARTPAAEAVPRLLDLYGDRVAALAHRLCRNRSDAEDAVQDVFLQAFRKWHTFRGEADPGTWLYTMTVRACRARRRAAAVRRTHAASDIMPWSETTITELAAAPETDADPAERDEAIDRVRAAVAALPEHLRLPIVLKEMLGLSVDDAAATLGLAANTVKTRLHRARLALRKAMLARAPAVPAPAPIYERQVCLDLLKAKMEAMDRGGVRAGFRVPRAELCDRCRAVFRELDIVQDACAAMAAPDMPQRLRRTILAALAERERSQSPRPRRRGRPPRTARTGPAAG